MITKYFGTEKVNTGRQDELDMVKGLAIIFIVWCHVFEILGVDVTTIPGIMVDSILGGPFAAPMFIELMHNRYSCRNFTEEPVSDAVISYLKEAIYCAPTARNQQPLRVWFLSGEAHMEKMRKITKYHYNAPLTVAIGYEEKEGWVRASDGQNSAVIDASIAATQMWLAAADIGLGSVWVADYDTTLLPELFPEFEGCKIVAFMQTGKPGAKAKPIAWHSQKRSAEEIFKN